MTSLGAKMAEIMEQRTVQEVTKIMGFAKVDPTDVKDTVQCFNFAQNLDNEHIKLMEIDDEIMQHLKEGEKLTVRGMKDDFAVVCTNDKTYQMREQETSNSLLIVPDMSYCEDLASSNPDTELKVAMREVCALKYQYYEVQAIQPKLKRIKELLEVNLYDGEEYEKDNEQNDKKYTYTNILNEVQASEAEILKGLKRLEACQIDGYQRILSFDFQSTVVTHITNLIEEHGWSLDKIPVNECCETLKDLFRPEVVKHVLKCLCEEADKTDATWRLSEDKVCRFFAEMILRPVAGFKLSEFEQVWQESVLDGLKTSRFQLEGLALIDRDSLPVSIRYFSVMELPEKIEDRFNRLFTIKEKWTMDEISPYIQELSTDKLSVGALLTKYARASTVNGMKLFNSKRVLR